MSVPEPSAKPSPNIAGFEIAREIASGGMATVYLATQESLGRKVALKMLRAFDNADHSLRFLNESRIIGSLNHRNVITIYDVGDTGEQAFISMEYLEGGDLASRIDQGPLGYCDALEIAAAIGDCLQFVHDQGIIHRDVKPANILFHRDGTPVLTDFGIATDVNLETNLTACGAMVGSPCYLSPEQAESGELDGRTDIYSLGVVLYEMLVGRPPFHEDSAVETMAAHLTTPPPCLPEPLRMCQALLDRALAKRPADRFQTPSEFVDAMRDLQINLAANRGMPHGSLINGFAALHQFVRALGGSPRAASGAAIVLLVMVSGSLLLRGLSDPDPIDTYLNHARSAFEQSRLSYPREGSASYYYRKVIDLDPRNDQALDGLHEIAEHYAGLVESDLSASNFSSAKFHLARGLEVESGNDRLVVLQRQMKGLRTLPEKVVSGIRSIFDR